MTDLYYTPARVRDVLPPRYLGDEQKGTRTAADLGELDGERYPRLQAELERVKVRLG